MEMGFLDLRYPARKEGVIFPFISVTCDSNSKGVVWKDAEVSEKSLEKGIVPCELKIASVVPIYKNDNPKVFSIPEWKWNKMWCCVIGFCHTYCYLVVTAEFLCFVTIWVFVLYHDLHFWVLSQFMFFFLKFCNNFRFWLSSQF